MVHCGSHVLRLQLVLTSLYCVLSVPVLYQVVHVGDVDLKRLVLMLMALQLQLGARLEQLVLQEVRPIPEKAS
jgi:hypothetical protein